MKAITLLCGLISATAYAAGELEQPQPNSTQTGITAISGWHCSAKNITVTIDGGPPIPILTGGARTDLTPICGHPNASFSLLYNYNGLSKGAHTMRVYADNTLFTFVNFNVTHFGVEFKVDLNGRYELINFPEWGVASILQWQQEKQNFSIVGTTTRPETTGNFYGTNLLNRTGCIGITNGSFYEAANASIPGYTSGNYVVNLTFPTTGLTCTFRGKISSNKLDSGVYNVQDGTFTCSNGQGGTWSSNRLEALSAGIVMNYTMKYTTSLACAITGKIAGARDN
jgi:hypothetical protein